MHSAGICIRKNPLYHAKSRQQQPIMPVNAPPAAGPMKEGRGWEVRRRTNMRDRECTEWTDKEGKSMPKA
eukprot:12577681-Alexandrium_andersonii.AAC.1